MERRPYLGEPPDERLRREPPTDLTDDDRVLATDEAVILNGLFACSSPLQVESSIGFARYLSSVGINRANYPIFLRLLQTNNRWVVDALVERREPPLLFSSIQPNNFLVSKAFLLLSLWHPGQIYEKVLRAVMGIIECAFYDPDDGYRIYRLKVGDINNVGKFLDEGKDQFDPVNALVLHVLDRISQIGTYETVERKRTLAKHAFDIRLAYFDNRKQCADVIPQVLLTRVDREEDEVRPSKGYAAFLEVNE